MALPGTTRSADRMDPSIRRDTGPAFSASFPTSDTTTPTTAPTDRVNTPYTPPTTEPLTSDSMAPPDETSQITIPEIEIGTRSDEFARGTDATLEQLIDQANEPTDAEKRQTDLQKEILSLGDIDYQEKKTLAQLEEEKGVTEQRNRLGQLTDQLTALQFQRAAIPLQIQEESLGRGRTRAGVEPIETGRLRNNAIQALGIAAQAHVIQGNIARAQQSISQMIELEFEPQRQRLAALQQAYEFNRDILEREDSKKTRELEILLEERSRGLNEAMQERTFTRNLELQAIQSGAPYDVARKMGQSTPEEAMAIGAQYLGAEFERQAEQQAFDNNIRLEQLALQRDQFNFTRRQTLLASAREGDAEAIATLGYDPNDLPLSTEQIEALDKQLATLDKDKDRIDGLLANTVGLETSSGRLRSLWFEGGMGVGPLKAFDAKQKFINDAKYVLNNVTFDKIQELSDRGIKLTPISDREFGAMRDAANELATASKWDEETGDLLGFDIPEPEVRRLFRAMSEHYAAGMADVRAQMVVTSEDEDEIKNL